MPHSSPRRDTCAKEIKVKCLLLFIFWLPCFHFYCDNFPLTSFGVSSSRPLPPCPLRFHFNISRNSSPNNVKAVLLYLTDISLVFSLSFNIIFYITSNSSPNNIKAVLRYLTGISFLRFSSSSFLSIFIFSFSWLTNNKLVIIYLTLGLFSLLFPSAELYIH